MPLQLVRAFDPGSGRSHLAVLERATARPLTDDEIDRIIKALPRLPANRARDNIPLDHPRYKQRDFA